MNRILHLNTSIFGSDGQSSKLATRFVERIRTPHTEVVHRDLAADPIPHLTAETFQAALTPKEERTPAQSEAAALADTLIDEIANADTLVLGLPMYNFGVPSSVKAWFDHIARAGSTFRYTENGPIGLLEGKQVFVFATRGGVYKDSDADLQTPFVKQYLSLLGIDNVEFIYAEGLAIDENSREQALESASRQLNRLAA